MATIKVKFEPLPTANGEGSVYYQITHGRRVRRLTTGFKLFAAEWNVDRPAPWRCAANRRSELLRISSEIRLDLQRLSRIINSLDEEGEYDVRDVVYRYRTFMRDYSLFGFMSEIIERLHTAGRLRTAETYTAALRSFGAFRDGHDIMLDAISCNVVDEYQLWMQARGLTDNSKSFYNRILRAVYNRAVEAGVIDQLQPFRHAYTGVAKTVKRALPLCDIRRIHHLDLADAPALGYARDIFMLSFFMRGMSFVDMACLRKTDLRGGYVTYRRRKTGQLMMVKWTAEMQSIVDRYPGYAPDYLLPLISAGASSLRCAYRNASYNINRRLHIIGSKLGLGIPLTLYVARHSWATAARATGVPVGVISEGMGHESEATTRIYLASLDTSVVDRANSLIIRSI